MEEEKFGCFVRCVTFFWYYGTNPHRHSKRLEYLTGNQINKATAQSL